MNTNQFIYRIRRPRKACCGWLIQRRVEGGWKNQRGNTGMPLMAATEYKAEQLVRTLDGTLTYRIVEIQD